jgi:uncharacterized protein
VDPTVRHVLTAYRTWAVVGWSPSPYRDSHRIAALLESRSYEVLRVNPNCEDTYATLADIEKPVEVVDLFRRSEFVAGHVDQAIAIGAKAVWMQLEVIDHAAAQRARDAGLEVVMDRCPAIELPRLAGASR